MTVGSGRRGPGKASRVGRSIMDISVRAGGRLQQSLINPVVRLAWDLRLPIPGDALLETTGRRTGLRRRTPVCGAVYLDSSGEPPFIRQVFEEFGPRAERTRAVLLTAFGYDYVPGNLAGALALRAAGPAAARVRVG
jgi:hypothetical protein